MHSPTPLRPSVLAYLALRLVARRPWTRLALAQCEAHLHTLYIGEQLDALRFSEDPAESIERLLGAALWHPPAHESGVVGLEAAREVHLARLCVLALEDEPGHTSADGALFALDAWLAQHDSVWREQLHDLLCAAQDDPWQRVVWRRWRAHHVNLAQRRAPLRCSVASAQRSTQPTRRDSSPSGAPEAPAPGADVVI